MARARPAALLAPARAPAHRAAARAAAPTPRAALPPSSPSGRRAPSWRWRRPLSRQARTKLASRLTPDAIDLLKQDHAAVKKAFKQFEKAKYKDPNARREFIATICNELTMHTELEERIFYPAVRAKIKDDQLMNEAPVEHDSAKQLIAELRKMQGDDPMLKPTASVLSEYVNHHVREEEREILPKAKRLKLDLAGLADEMRARKEHLKARM